MDNSSLGKCILCALKARRAVLSGLASTSARCTACGPPRRASESKECQPAIRSATTQWVGVYEAPLWALPRLLTVSTRGGHRAVKTEPTTKFEKRTP